MLLLVQNSMLLQAHHNFVLFVLEVTFLIALSLLICFPPMIFPFFKVHSISDFPRSEIADMYVTEYKNLEPNAEFKFSKMRDILYRERDRYIWIKQALASNHRLSSLLKKHDKEKDLNHISSSTIMFRFFFNLSFFKGDRGVLGGLLVSASFGI